MASSYPFHGQYDAQPHLKTALKQKHVDGKIVKGKRETITRHTVIKNRALSFRFFPHFHPYVGELIERLVEDSVKGLQAEDTHYVEVPPTQSGGQPGSRPFLYEEFFDRYEPSDLVDEDYYPVKDLDFTPGGAYSVYNWELFFHVPLTIAIGLSRNGRYQEAQRWFHYVFDPTDDSDGPTPERYWKVKPFQHTEVRQIEEILVNLSTGRDQPLRELTIRSIEALKDAPFRPHLVARYRQSAYMFKTVMAYLDNLIAWGDSLFRQDSREAINEATQIYVLAANILGPRPEAVPEKGSVRPQTYADLSQDLDAFSNALREIEADVPFDVTPPPAPATNGDQRTTLRNFGTALYFCVPRNDKLLSYWDTVADRLFKIRNSLNILGIFRQLPLFAPPIDPALMAKAAAAGLDVDAIVAGANQPLPIVRFQPLLQKAMELSQEVKSLGGALLAAIEKEDNEALAVLRAKHERSALEIAETVRYQQYQEAIKNREGVLKTLATATQRYVYYERLLGQQEGDVQVPQLEDVDKGALEKMKFKAEEPEIPPREIEIDIASGAEAIAEGHKISTHELQELEKLSGAQTAQDTAAVLDTIAAIINLIPMFGVDVKPIGIGGGLEIGGPNIAALLSTLAGVSRAVGARQSFEASEAAKIGGYARREQDWAFQSNQAAAEITQQYKQLRAAQIRESIAERELKNHQQAIKNSKEIEQFLTDERAGKRTNTAFYGWMKREAKALHSQCFQLAFDTAKKAERALQHELGDPEASFISYGYTAGKEGLHAGEKLHLDLKRMDLAYSELNRREYELTKHVSLNQVNPIALMQLRATGSCTLELPEELFDMDGPGHYFRRIKSVAVSVPCVTGPYTSVNCTLNLLKSSIRRTPILRDGGYAREGLEDDRFSDHFGSLESIVTSSSQNDSGMFETNLRDEQFLPFEGSGAISEWRLQLPASEDHNVRQFDYDTIADVILHIRYTAREGGDLMRNGALGNLETAIAEARAAGSVRLLSIRHEFPGAWAKFKSAPAATATKLPELKLELKAEHYPFWAQGRLDTVESVTGFARAKSKVDLFNKADPTAATAKQDSLEAKVGDLRWGRLANISNPAPIGAYTLYLKNDKVEDLWLALAWAGEES